MAFDSTPWFVGGGAQHSPETARVLAYAATNGAEGVAGVDDLKVQAQAVPNGTVQVLTGAALLLNRYPGGNGQTYALRNATATAVTVTPTGSGGGRTDLVVARVLDPQYEGVAPPNPLTFQYAFPTIIQGVSAGTKTAKELNLGYPAVALAKITLPASTATVTAGMITDLRRVANPRRERAMRTVYATAALSMTNAYGYWPINAAQRPIVHVPSWATHLDIVVHISGAKFVKGSTADFVAGIRTMFGAGNYGEHSIIVQDAEDTNGRYHYSLIGSHKITAAMRDTDQSITLQAQRTSTTGNVTADPQTSVIIDWEFSEVAE
ncbi:hypothetical protein AAFM46_11035 [Arthrobacter sp. TMP15]|uniref:hypothetical protein n=1 Tax=Arthrobacter sp. TMP15 TaxID=3140789 RepID=UPI0031BBB9E9